MKKSAVTNPQKSKALHNSSDFCTYLAKSRLLINHVPIADRGALDPISYGGVQLRGPDHYPENVITPGTRSGPDSEIISDIIYILVKFDESGLSISTL